MKTQSSTNEYPRPREWLVVALFAICGGFAVSFFATRPGFLSVSSNPAEAEILVDGRAFGITPENIEVKRGIYRVEIRKPGFHPFIQIVKVGPGTTTSLAASLMPAVQAEDVAELSRRVAELRNELDVVEAKAKNLAGLGRQEVAELSEEVETIKLSLEPLVEAVLESPGRALSLPLMNKDLELLKEENKAIRSELDRVSGLIWWLIAIVTTFAIGVLGAVVSIISAFLRGRRTQSADIAGCDTSR